MGQRRRHCTYWESSGSQSAERYQYSDANLNAIQQLGSEVTSDGQLTATYPAQSITLWVVSPDVPTAVRVQSAELQPNLPLLIPFATLLVLVTMSLWHKLQRNKI